VDGADRRTVGPNELGTERLGCAPAEAAILGDRLDTDIMGGSRAGLTTIMVQTGVSKPEDVERSPIKPDYVFEGLPALEAALAARQPASTR
jgi:ribonucleotide monophosphatase NagD (HAD superfamily)